MSCNGTQSSVLATYLNFSRSRVYHSGFNSVFDFPVKQICHRDLKLENTLLDGSPAPRLKICDFGYSKVLFISLKVCFLNSKFIYATVWPSAEQRGTSCDSSLCFLSFMLFTYMCFLLSVCFRFDFCSSINYAFLFFSLLFFIPNQSQLLVLLHTLHQRFFFDRNMMAR